jgi:hypothetical protein
VTEEARTAPPSFLSPTNPTSLNSPITSSLSAASPLTSRAPPGAREGSMRLMRALVMWEAGRRIATCEY